MQRHTFAMQIKKGELLNYRKTLGEVWPEVKNLFDTYNLRNFSLWSVDLIVFGYYESDDDFRVTDDFLAKTEELDGRFDDIYDWISEPCKPMRLMFHNYGGVQESKELVYKKIFVIHLFEGMAEEYKRRHDAVLPTPEQESKHRACNNFTIWNAGDYVFGYMEMDATLEREKTPEHKEYSRNWETSMLEIMEWVTNDVDWLTGEYHSNYYCIASYK